MEKVRKADIILQGASFYAGRGLPPDYDYIALTGNRITALGKGPVPEQLAGSHTKIYGFGKENLVTAGFHDHHIHLVLAGMLDKYARADGCGSREEAAERMKLFAETIPSEKWVIGFGFSRFEWEDKSFPEKGALDAVLPDRPVLVMDNELHSAWVNSKALEAAGVTAETEDPPYGKIGRLENGEPSGFLYETALALVAKHAFAFSDDIAEDLIRRYMKTANAWGITSASDMTPYLGIDLSYFNVFQKMAEEEALTVRISAARDLFEDPSVFLEMRKQTESRPGSMYRVRYYKQFVDGVPSNHTAYMLEDYSDKPGERGGSLLPLDKLKKAVETANRNGIPVKLHACGDRAVRISLDAFENAAAGREKPGADPEESGYGKGFVRNQIEHIEVIHPDDIPRFRRLGVVASVQPEHIVSGIRSHEENDYPQLLGPVRERYTWPFRSLLESGAVLACGSDMPVVPGNPMEGLYVGMTRLHRDGTPEGGWNPGEKLSIGPLLDGYTSGAAFGEGTEAELGTLEVGKLADIAVFDTNFLKAEGEAVRNGKALLTIADGKVVFENLKG